MNYPLANRIIRPERQYTQACATDIRRTIKDAKKKGPLLGGPVTVTVVEPLDMQHPEHSRFALQRRQSAGTQMSASDPSPRA